MAGSYKPFRRTAITASAVGIAVAVTALTGPLGAADAGTAATTATAGSASATATSFKVNPTTASLSIGITFGIALAAYTNNVSQSESRALDLGIIGSTLAGEGCDGGDPTLPAEDQPQPLRADSRDPSSAQGKTENEKFLPAITKSVIANPSPFSEANTITAGLNASQAFLKLGAAHSRTMTRLSDGNREAIATVDIGSIGIAGVLELTGLKWSARSSTGKDDANDGSFTIGALKVLGQSLPVGDSLKAIEGANAVLGTLGIQIGYPKAHVSAGILFVDPLVIKVVPSKTRDSISQLVLGTIQPVRENLYTALLEQDCGNATYITVSDIAVGSLTGAGSFALELGGVQTKSEELKTSSFLGIDPTGSLSSNDGFDGLNDLIDTPILGDLAPLPTGDAPTISKKPQRAKLAATEKGSRGGRMAAVGLGGLLALLLVADRDRRLMRRAQRLTPTEA